MNINIAEVLTFTDELVFTNTGQHLNHLQEKILNGCLQGHKYAKIASENYLSEGHVRDTASELWQKLSESLREDVNKLNVRNILERNIIFNSGSIRYLLNTNKITIDSTKVKLPKSSPTSKPIEKDYIDINNAPEITEFYGRNNEINTLKNLLIQEHCRIITLFGITGIGKTTLAVKLIEEVSTPFEYIVYRSLRYCPSIDNFITDLLQSFVSPRDIPSTVDRQINLLLKFLRQHRCLMVIDDLQMLFKSGEFAGQYQAEFEGYYLLFKQIAELSHTSSLLLITSEQPEDVNASRRKFTRCLNITGLGDFAKPILQDKDLLDEEVWDILIEKYQGHPLWLEMTATMIQELFAGSVSEFLSTPSLIISNEISLQLNRIWGRLTETEKQIVNYLAKQDKAVTLSQVLQEKPNNYTTEIILNTIQSLKRRGFLKNEQNGDRASLLRLNRTLEGYVRSLNS